MSANPNFNAAHRELVHLQARAYNDGYNDLAKALMEGLKEIERQGYTEITLEAMRAIINRCCDATRSVDIDPMIDLITSKADGSVQ